MPVTPFAVATTPPGAGVSTTRTLTVPAGIAAGDAAMLFASNASSVGTFTVTDNGLTRAVVQVGTNATFSGHLSALYKIVNLSAADAGKVITLTTAASLKTGAILVIYRGLSATDFVNAFASKTAAAASASPVTPAAAATAAGTVQLDFIAPTRGNTIPQITNAAPPSNAVRDAQVYSSENSGSTGVIAGHDFTTVNPTGSGGSDQYTLDQAAVYSAWTVMATLAAQPPTVDAGPAQTWPFGTIVELRGSDSGGATSRAWTAQTWPGATAPTLTGATTATATFTATLPGIYTFQYSATNASGTTTATTTVYATTTDARPSAVSVAGTWVAVGAADLAAALADNSALTYAESVTAPNAASFRVDLPPMPAGPKTVNYDLVDSAPTPAGTWLIELLQAGTVIASWNETVADVLVSRAQALTSAQNAAITDPNRLQLRFTATVV